MNEKVCLDNKIVLKIANPTDLPIIFDLVDDYSGELEIDRTKVKNSIREVVYIQGAILVEYEGSTIGGIAGYSSASMINDEMLFTVMFFYVRKDYRCLTKYIIKELELVLLPTKTTMIIFGIIMNKTHYKLSRFMRMMGYDKIETHMAKRI